MNTLLKTCVELSTDYQIKFQRRSSPQCTDLFEQTLGMLTALEWKELFGKKIIFLPVILLLFIVMLLVAIVFYPFFKVSDWVERRKNIFKIKENGNKFNEYMALDGQDSLDSLWRWFGPDENYPLEERISLLEKWLNVLYGRTVANSIDVKKNLDDQYQSQAETMKKMKATCVLFVDALESVIANISKDYPLFEHRISGRYKGDFSYFF